MGPNVIMFDMPIRLAWSRGFSPAQRIPESTIVDGDPGALATSIRQVGARGRGFKSHRPHHFRFLDLGRIVACFLAIGLS